MGVLVLPIKYRRGRAISEQCLVTADKGIMALSTCVLIVIS